MASELDVAALDILRGRLGPGGTPLVPPRVVRVYLCSTGPDSQTERNAFVDRVYPKLREHCRNKFGVEFQIVDLEWGLPADTHVTPVSAEFRQGEIIRCQDLSAGPTFIAFVGQKYGDCPLQATILASEFETLRIALQKHRGRGTRSAPLLDDWYVKDDNHDPPVYVLKPAIQMIEDLASVDENKRSAAELQQSEITAKLRQLLQRGAELSYNDGGIDSDTKNKFFMSEQELEMTMGICDSNTPQRHCLLIQRNIIDLKNYIKDERTPAFTEIRYNHKTDKLEFDAEAEQKLHQVKTRTKNLMSHESTLSYDVLWRYDDVISSKHHKEYLDNLCSDVYERLIHLIDETVPQRRFDFPEVCEEPLLHLNQCKQLGEEFYGREEALGEVEEYLQEESSCPLIIFGQPGSGKTKLLSKIALEIPSVVGDGAVVIVRYIGLTPMSSDIRHILLSLCSQLCAVLDRDPEGIPSDFKDLGRYFNALLMSVPNYLTVTLLLDGLGNMLPDLNAHALTWIPCSLPVNVKVILTCNPDPTKIPDILESPLVTEGSKTLQLESLSGDECEHLMREIMAGSGKQLSQDQYEVYKHLFTKCSLPMFVRLLAEEAKTLHSFVPTSYITRPSGIEDAVNKYFDKLEGHHGKMFVSRCMAFLAASSTGLSDCEMEDLLSLDEDVLNDVYCHHHPAIRRIPPTKWLELKHHLEPFMTSRNTEGATVYTWNHSLFLQITQSRYLNDEEVNKSTHSVLADYYLGTWADNPKPVSALDSKNGMIPLPCDTKADRKVPSQPLTFQRNGSGIRFNKRKYDKVPRHLDLSGRADELNSLILFNYEWLYNKIKALSLQHIMTDFALSPGPEASLVEGALRVAEPVLQRDINNLAPELTGHLLPYYSSHPHIRELLNQCDTIGLKNCALIPNFPYHQVPGTSLQFTIDCPVPSEYFGFVNSDKVLLSKERNSPHIYMFDLQNGELKQTVFASNGDFLVTPNGKYLAIVDHVTEKAIKFHHADNGSFIGQIIILNHIRMKPNETYKKGPMCVTDERLCAIVTTETSYLCIVDVPACKLLTIIDLDGKSSVCEISPDGQYVYCSSNEFLLTYDLESLDLIGSINVGYKPTNLTFTQDGYRAFLANNLETKLYTLHLSCGFVDMSYKSNFDDELQGDVIMDIKVSPNDDFILVRGKKNLLVHERATENVYARFERPADIPAEFRLPKSHYKELHFTQAEFSRDGLYVIGTIFRNVYIWEISTKQILTTLQAPLGIITSLLVTRQSSQVITQLHGQKAIQVWNIEEAVNKVDMLDKVEGPIQQILMTEMNSTAFIQCHNSDAIGVVDLATGTMLDLLTHDCDVKDVAITPNGNYLMLSVSPKMSNTAVRIWDMSERRIIKEFGNVPGYCICFKGKMAMAFVGQKDQTFCAPYYIRTIHFTRGGMEEEEHSQALKFVLQKPFVTRSDDYLVVLTAQEYFKHTGVYDTPTICIFDMKHDMKLTCYTMESLGLRDNIDRIVDLRRSPALENIIAVTYTKGMTPDINHNDIENCFKSSECGLMLFDVSSGWVTHRIEPFMKPSVVNSFDVVFSNDFKFCIDDQSTINPITTEDCARQIANPPSMPRTVALGGTVVIYYKGSLLYAIRIRDNAMIAQCEVHAPVCHVEMCSDDRTLVIGCTDGTLVSFVLIDPDIDDPKAVLARVGSRQTGDARSPVDMTQEVKTQKPSSVQRPSRSSQASRSWDRVDVVSSKSYSRPPSVMSAGPREKELLKRIPHLSRERPKSDTQLYSKSAVCSVM